MKERFVSFINSTKGKVAAAVSGTAVATVVAALPVLAEGEPTVDSAMSSAFTTAVANINSTIVTLLPIVLPIVGTIVAITVGVKIFKRLAKG